MATNNETMECVAFCFEGNNNNNNNMTHIFLIYKNFYDGNCFSVSNSLKGKYSRMKISILCIFIFCF